MSTQGLCEEQPDVVLGRASDAASTVKQIADGDSQRRARMHVLSTHRFQESVEKDFQTDAQAHVHTLKTQYTELWVLIDLRALVC
jgi:hypothetical protein